jgi:RNA polymerase sigma factor (sigma-70 family)
MDELLHKHWEDFERIFKQHHHRVYAICLRMMGNIKEAEDLTEDVFLQVFRRLQSFPTEAPFSTWLYRLTVNRVLLHFRGNLMKKEQRLRLTEIDRALGRPDGISKSRLRKARMKLRKLRAVVESLREDRVLGSTLEPKLKAL